MSELKETSVNGGESTDKSDTNAHTRSGIGTTDSLEKSDQASQHNSSELTDLFNKQQSSIINSIPLTLPMMQTASPATNSTDNSASQPAAASTDPSVLTSVIEHIQKLHQTFLTDNLRTQKSEMEELKEKIMKLEQRNSELEKKLSTTSNNTAAVNNNNETNKDNSSLNDSFSLLNTNNTNDDSLNITNNSAKFGENHSSPNVNTTQATPLIMNHQQVNNGLLMSTKTLQNTTPFVGSTFPQNLNTIPNINQGGFIITSNGSITYVPPMPATVQTSTPTLANQQLTPKHSNTQIDPAMNNASNPFGCLLGDDQQFKLDFDCGNKNSTPTSTITTTNNLDLNSLLAKNLFNLNGSTTTLPAHLLKQNISPVLSANKTQKSPSTTVLKPASITIPAPASASSTTTPTSTSSAPATAFILSNGQLLPVIAPSTNPSATANNESTKPSLSPHYHQLILPAPATKNNIPIQPKPIASEQPAPPVTTKNSKGKKTANPKSKPNKQTSTPVSNTNESSMQIDLSNLLSNNTSLVTPVNSTATTTQLTSTSIVTNNATSPANQTINTVNAASTTASQNGAKKPREIRPKPSSSTNLLNISTFTNIPAKKAPANRAPTTTILTLPALAAVPATTTTVTTNNTTNTSNNKIVNFSNITTKTNELSCATNNVVILESNDILSKAASMIFSPSEFSLNNLSPNNPIQNNTAIINTQTDATNILNGATSLSSLSPTGGSEAPQFITSAPMTVSSTTSTLVPIAPNTKPNNKVPIQRNSSQSSTSSNRKLTTLKPSPTTNSKNTVSSSSTTTKTANSSTKNRKIVASNSTSQNKSSIGTNNTTNCSPKPNKILLPSLKSASIKPAPASITTSPNKATVTDAISIQPKPTTIVVPSSVNSATNGFNIIDFQKYNESLVSICGEVESFSNTVILNQQPAQKLEQPLINLDSNIQLQLQLQSLLNSNAIMFNLNEQNQQIPAQSTQSDSTEKRDEQAKNPANNDKSTEKKQINRSKSPEILSMPSLEQFFEIESNQSSSIIEDNTASANSSANTSINNTIRPAIKPKPANNQSNTNKKLVPLAPNPTASTVQPNKKIKEILKPDFKTNSSNQKPIKPKDLTVTTNSPIKKKPVSINNSKAKSDESNKQKSKTESPSKDSKINEKSKTGVKPILPKKSVKAETSNPEQSEKNDAGESVPEKIKFEFTDLDKVLDQVESIAAAAAIAENDEMTKSQSNQAVSLTNPSKNRSDSDSSSNDFLFDLLNIQTSSSTAAVNGTTSPLDNKKNTDPFKLNTFTVNPSKNSTKKPIKRSKQINKKVDDLNKSDVLSTPPSLSIQNKQNTAKKFKKQLKLPSGLAGDESDKDEDLSATPIKITYNDDDDIFSFLNNTTSKPLETPNLTEFKPSVQQLTQQQRTPLKPDNHQQQINKKRGRPPKPSSTAKNYENNNSDLNVKSSGKIDQTNSDGDEDDDALNPDLFTDDSDHKRPNKISKHNKKSSTNNNRQIGGSISDSIENHDESNSNLLAFQELIPKLDSDSNNLNDKNNSASKTADCEDDFNNFVYDIADIDGVSANTTCEETKKSDISDKDQQLTITSLAKRKRTRTPGANCDTKLSTEFIESAIASFTTSVTNLDSIKNKRRRNTLTSSDDENDDSAELSGEISDIKNENESISPIFSKATGEKRKRGRPPKASNQKATDNTKSVTDSTGYKKINNSGTTSILSLGSGCNIEYAGLTRFEIPYELATAGHDADSISSTSNKNNNDNTNENSNESLSRLPKLDDNILKDKPVDSSYNNNQVNDQCLKQDINYDTNTASTTTTNNNENNNTNTMVSQDINMMDLNHTNESEPPTTIEPVISNNFSNNYQMQPVMNQLDDNEDDDDSEDDESDDDDELDEDIYNTANTNNGMNILDNNHYSSHNMNNINSSNNTNNNFNSANNSLNQVSTSVHKDANDNMISLNKSDVNNDNSMYEQNQQQYYSQDNGNNNNSSGQNGNNYWKTESNVVNNSNNTNNNNHMSHYDLENDPILNNDLQNFNQIQQQHVSSYHMQQVKPSNNSSSNNLLTSTSTLIITPPSSTVSSVSSNSSSCNQHINSSSSSSSISSTNLSINPSSTSSTTSSTQMISPVSITSIENQMPNSNSNNNPSSAAMRSSSVDTNISFGYYSNSSSSSSSTVSNNTVQGSNNQQFYSTTSNNYQNNPAYSNNNASAGYNHQFNSNSTSNINLNINNRANNNSSPQLNSTNNTTTQNNTSQNGMYNNPSRSHSVAPTPPLQMNTSQSPHHRHSTSLSSTPTPSTPTPTPGPQMSTVVQAPTTPNNNYNYSSQIGTPTNTTQNDSNGSLNGSSGNNGSRSKKVYQPNEAVNNLNIYSNANNNAPQSPVHYNNNNNSNNNSSNSQAQQINNNLTDRHNNNYGQINTYQSYSAPTPPTTSRSNDFSTMHQTNMFNNQAVSQSQQNKLPVQQQQLNHQYNNQPNQQLYMNNSTFHHTTPFHPTHNLASHTAHSNYLAPLTAGVADSIAAKSMSHLNPYGFHNDFMSTLPPPPLTLPAPPIPSLNPNFSLHQYNDAAKKSATAAPSATKEASTTKKTTAKAKRSTSSAKASAASVVSAGSSVSGNQSSIQPMGTASSSLALGLTSALPNNSSTLNSHLPSSTSLNANSSSTRNPTNPVASAALTNWYDLNRTAKNEPNSLASFTNIFKYAPAPTTGHQAPSSQLQNQQRQSNQSQPDLYNKIVPNTDLYNSNTQQSNWNQANTKQEASNNQNRHTTANNPLSNQYPLNNAVKPENGVFIPGSSTTRNNDLNTMTSQHLSRSYQHHQYLPQLDNLNSNSNSSTTSSSSGSSGSSTVGNNVNVSNTNSGYNLKSSHNGQQSQQAHQPQLLQRSSSSSSVNGYNSSSVSNGSQDVFPRSNSNMYQHSQMAGINGHQSYPQVSQHQQQQHQPNMHTNHQLSHHHQQQQSQISTAHQSSSSSLPLQPSFPTSYPNNMSQNNYLHSNTHPHHVAAAHHQSFAHHLNQAPVAAAMAAAFSQNQVNAMSTLLANQFSNVSQFNWHPTL